MAKVSELAKLLLAARKASGLTQTEVSRILGYSSAQFISNWERGLSDPPLETIGVLVKIYKIKPEVVLETIMKDQSKLLRSSIVVKGRNFKSSQRLHLVTKDNKKEKNRYLYREK